MSDTPVPPVAASLANSIVGGKAAGTQSRYLKDNLARWVVWIGGLGVIVALMLIFIYLLSEVVPLFRGAEMNQRQEFVVPGGQGKTLYFAAEEQGEVGMRLVDSGAVVFFDLYNGKEISQVQLPLGGQGVVAARELSPEAGTVGTQLADGSVLVFRHKYLVSYPNDKRVITPGVEYPYGETPLAFMSEPGHALALRENQGTLLMAAAGNTGMVHLRAYEKTESLLGDASFDMAAESSFAPPVKADHPAS